jgi:serine/threonine-protein kinase
VDTKTWERIESLFFDALERPAAERAAFLDDACRGAPELRAEVDAMLAAHGDESGLRLERVLLDSAPAAATAGAAGLRLGPWRLERLLGKGGMGEVWLARRADGAYEMSAAVKLVRPGWSAAQLAPRFRRERALLARLQHPHIAKLLDGGITDAGLPYLVMEYVDGEPVTEWCDARRAGIRERLRLFRTICEAVRVAHANLVIHRDLKPANILVTKDGRPILLDFGISKLLDPEESGEATRDEERALTPEHAAPEQLRGEAVTIATDVWALGVLLYELLARRRPFSLEGRSRLDFERTVQTEDPPPPSAAAPAKELRRALRGDLDRIVMKALRKEPERRYLSAEDFSDDVDRYLAGLPVRAAPDTHAYRLRKFVRRRRVPLAVAGLVAGLAAAFVVTSLRQAREVARERDAAVEARGDSDRAVQMLVDLFGVASPREMPGGDSLRVDDLLRLAEEKLDASTDAPRVRAKLWRTLAAVHFERSRFDRQRVALDHALAAAEEAALTDDVLAIRHERARLVWITEGRAAAEPLLRESLARHEARFGPDAPDVAVAAQDLAGAVEDVAEKRALLERSLAIQRRNLGKGIPGDSVGVASSLNALGAFYWSQGNHRLAQQRFEESLGILETRLPHDHPDVMSVRSNIAACLGAMGSYAEEEKIHRDLLESRRRVFGPDGGPVAATLQLLGVNLVSQRRFAEAADVLRQAATVAERAFGVDHRDAAGWARDLAIAQARAGRVEDARSTILRARAAAVRRNGPLSPEIPELDATLARMDVDEGRPVSMEMLRAAERTVRNGEPPDRFALGCVLAARGLAALRFPENARPGEAEEAYSALLALWSPKSPEEGPAVAQVRCALEIARASSGTPWDRARLEASLRRCESWGQSDPYIVETARGLLAGTLKHPSMGRRAVDELHPSGSADSTSTRAAASP